MKSPIPWLGGKSRLADRIIQQFPPHKRYAEAFTGAGWVFFRKPQIRLESLNDINGELIAFYRVLKSHLEEFCRQFKWLLTSREMFSDFKRQQEAGGLTDIQKACRFYYLQRLAFGGRTSNATFGVDKTSPPRINLVRMEEDLSAIHLRLAGVVIENLPWEEYVSRYDASDTLFYLDPPYFGCESDYGKGLFHREDFKRMAEVLDGIAGKFICSINDVPEIRQTFAAFRLQEIETAYTVAKRTPKKARELLVMNFDPEEDGLLGMCEK